MHRLLNFFKENYLTKYRDIRKATREMYNVHACQDTKIEFLSYELLS